MKDFILQYREAISISESYTSDIRLLNSFRMGVEIVDKNKALLESPTEFLDKFMEVMKTKVPSGIHVSAATYDKDCSQFVEIQISDENNPHFYTVEVRDQKIAHIKPLSDFIV
jgi:hypothetical protein